jgi:flavin reductase (DIM6/NTAB) family NADH-FMN oxidoreductase RutF
MTIGSFTSVSLEPRLVGFFPAITSTTWPRIAETGKFAVNVLGAHQKAVGSLLAARDGDRFAGLSWSPAPSGCPILEDCVAYFDCDIESVQPAGDHWVVLGRVRELAAVGAGSPLVFHRGGFHALVPA